MRQRILLITLAIALLETPWITACADSKGMDSFSKSVSSVSKGTESIQKVLASDQPSDAGAKATSQPANPAAGRPAEGESAPIMLWVKKGYPWDNALHSEFSINGKTINIYTSDTTDSIGEYLKPGWNTLAIKTTVQEPATKNNGLTFRIGPMRKVIKGKREEMLMDPVLWEFHNHTDWKFGKDKQYSHPLGPGVKEVTLSFRVYFASLQQENAELKAGDFVLTGKPHYTPDWNSPVTATVFVNGTPLNTFTAAPRQLVITTLLKEGKNEITLVSTRVKNSIQSNDIEFSVAGPAVWMVQKARFAVNPILQFNSMQGWTMDPRTGVLINKAKPDSETVERVIPFFLKEAPTGGK